VNARADADAGSESLPGALDRVYQALARAEQAAPATSSPAGSGGPPVTSGEPWHALERLCVLFGLSAFERDLLVLCAGHSLESRFAAGA